VCGGGWVDGGGVLVSTILIYHVSCFLSNTRQSIVSIRKKGCARYGCGSTTSRRASTTGFLARTL
jgi:hypothetical protein